MKITSLNQTTAHAVFVWSHTSKNRYKVISDSERVASLSFSPEPSILFKPSHCEFYRATAEVNEHNYFFKCLFNDGEFRGCMAIEDGAGQPFALFEEQPSPITQRQVSWLVLCDEAIAWLWLPGSGDGRWTVRGGGIRILEVKSPAPEQEGSVSVSHSSLLERPHAVALMLFCAYLAIGPKRTLSVAG